MLFEVKLYAAETGHTSEDPTFLGCLLVAAINQPDAQAIALDRLWDSRLDTTCSPQYEMRSVPQWLAVEEYETNSGETYRFCYNRANQKFHAVFRREADEWMAIPEELSPDSALTALANDVATSDLLENPDNWGVEQVDIPEDLPAWARNPA